MKITTVYGIIVILIIYMVYKCYSVLKLKHPFSYKTSKHSLFSEVVSHLISFFLLLLLIHVDPNLPQFNSRGSTPWFLPLRVTGSLHWMLNFFNAHLMPTAHMRQQLPRRRLHLIHKLPQLFEKKTKKQKK